MDLSFLPAVNASLNSLSTVMLIAGLYYIKQKRIETHKKCMLTAFAASCLFLVFYVTHYVWRARVHGGVHTAFNAQGAIKTAYYVLLISHIILAIFVPPLAIWMIRLGLKRRDATHRRVTHFGFPIWLYVSITGVVIYLMLYHFNPPPPA